MVTPPPVTPSPSHPATPSSPPAFTLIELLVVMGIIALLIGISVPLIHKVQIAGHSASTSAQLSTIANAIQQYHADYHSYPGPIPNSLLGGFYYTPAQSANITSLGATTSSGTTYTANGFTTYQQQHITGSENLVLGLLGGLEYDSTNNAFAYNPNEIYPDNTTPNPKGAMSLNLTRPKRGTAYLQVRSGDISLPNMANGNTNLVFTDAAGRKAADSMIPEFLDQFSDQMPILYLRANAGGTAVVGVAGTGDTGAALVQTNADSSTTSATPQYDLAQILGYTRCGPTVNSSAGASIGTNGSGSKPSLQFQGLQAIGNPTDTIPDTHSNVVINYKDALAYFKDPNNPGTSNAPDLSKTPPTFGNARQKDGYILISAGPDGIYGTADDIIYPGTLQP